MIALLLKGLAWLFKSLKPYWHILAIAALVIAGLYVLASRYYDAGAKSRDGEVQALKDTIAEVRTATAEAQLKYNTDMAALAAKYNQDRDKWDAELRNTNARSNDELERLRGEIAAGTYTRSSVGATPAASPGTAASGDAATGSNRFCVGAAKLDRLARLIGEAQGNTDKLATLQGWAASIQETP